MDAKKKAEAMRMMTWAHGCIDKNNGGTNFVVLADLRDALSALYTRQEFDEALRQLRIDGVLSLDSFEGLFGEFTQRMRDSAITENGSVLVYVSRR
jgi:hypothetical protein